MFAPIPSFFKIRCAFIVILILICIMQLGLTRAVAGTFSECTYYGLPAPYTSVPRFFESIGEAGDACVSDAADLGKSCQGPYDCTYPHSGCENQTPGYINYWIRVGYVNYEYLFCAVEGGGDDGGDSGTCPDERAVLETECGSLGYTIDENTCQGHCNTDGGECVAEKASLQEQCGDIGYTIIDQDTCEGRCNDCTQEAQEQCGDAEIIWNDYGDCSYQCREPCQELHDRLSYDCGGSDKYWLRSTTVTLADGSTSEKCEGGCGSPPTGHEDTDGDGDPDSTDEDMDGDGIPNDQDGDTDGDDIPNDDDTAPTVPGGSDESEPPGDYGDQNPDDPPPEDVPPPTWNCIEKWNNKKEECGEAGIAYWDNTTCTGRCNGDDPCGAAEMDAADQACPYGYKMNPDCTYTCYVCEKIQQDCVESCKPAAVIAVAQ